jgi:UDP-N-acetylmuramoyl-L-alanyl-D-glutamate--2,6-diaminopimelate ligase
MSAPRFDGAALQRLGVRRLTLDSRAVRPGDAFLACRGETRDGRDYIGEALARGAAAVLWEAEGYAWNRRWRVPHFAVPGLRRHAGEIAAEFYGRPSARLWTVGVTGTNGKTSCSQWIAQALTRARRKCAVIGTLGSGFPGRLDETINTTPDAVTLQARLRDFERAGAKAVCMEASSHGLAQDRLAGVEFDVALLTNLSRDHLDYHGTMRRYKAAKARLFRWPTLCHAVVNLDDGFGREIAQRWQHRRASLIGYGFGRRGARQCAARVEGRNLQLGAAGIAFDVVSPWGRAAVRSPLLGAFNAANLLATLSVLLASGVDAGEAAAALGRLAPVPGRMARYGGGAKPLVVVDYAHTPDALEKVLLALRPLRAPRGCLWCVFGCGGDRDAGKRPLMGAVAARLADRVVLTSDNPRGEDPRAIIADIAAGTGGAHEAIVDRRRAIRRAVAAAGRGDIVLVAGKGHENYQEIGGARRRFSDAAAVRAALAGRAR